jgi:probable HAF family extracellular repeat protein
MMPVFFMAFLWGGIMAGPSVAETITYTDMGYTLTLSDLGTLGGSNSVATAINKKGQVIGGSDTAGDVAWHSFLYSNATMTDLTQVVYDLFLVNFQVIDFRSGQIFGSCNWDGNYHVCSLTVPKK